ncbi:MAG: DUF1926 domain-containing protein, partial [Treponema sp.]|nr:DUF1926 domain-containing protein [Treponema sp.]
RSLYDRMMYISMLLAQGHGGDKVLKNLAKDKLWEAQSMFYYASFPSGMPASSEKRQEAFRLLNDAELLIRQGQASRKGAKELEEHSSIISYDYDRNGINEYVCSLRRLRLVITRLGAQIVELDNVFNGCNYASSPSCLSSFDESTDAYTRGFFAEHFFTGESLAEYGRTLHSAEGDSFASILFDEKKLDVKRNEITFSASCCLGASRVPVELIKKYTVLDDGISIQCILRNDGQEALKGFFVSESNFAQTDFSKNSLSQYSCELVLDGDTRRLDSSKPFMSSGGASALRVTDGYDKMQFNFVPNEEAGFIADLISFRRPDSYGLVGEDSKSLVTAFFWEIDLAPGRSVEKNINFSVTAVSGKKKRISPSL